jgi:nucleoside-diphosphate-sugar epimerase
MKRVLITGGAGSIGVDLVRRLCGHGCHVKVLDLPVCDFRSLETLDEVEILTGDITRDEDLTPALTGVDTVVHLAALLPPRSETDEQMTFRVNVEAVQKMLGLLNPVPSTHMVFASSVTTYGITAETAPPVTTEHPQNPASIYARSKVEAEEIIRDSGNPYSILRISGIAIPEFLEPPEVWPFAPDQRMEFINRADVVTALEQSVLRDSARGTVLNIAGGESWQLRGKDFIRGIYSAMGVPPEEARYLESNGSFDWYDTRESQRLLSYQETSFPGFLNMLEKAVALLMQG